MAMSTILYNVLSGLHYSDELLSTKFVALSGKLSPAFSADKLTIGAANGLAASTYSLPADDTKASESFGTASTVASEKNAKTYVDGAVAAANASNLTGATFNAPISGSVANKKVTIGLKYDNATLSANNGVLYSTFSLVKRASATDGYAGTYDLKDGNGGTHGTIDIPKDQFLKNAEYSQLLPSGAGASISGKPGLIFTFELTKDEGNGENGGTATNTDKVVYVGLNELVDVYTQGTGITITNHQIKWTPTAGQGIGINGATISAKLDVTNNSEGYLKLGDGGLYVSGVDSAITSKISELSGNYVTTPNNFAAANQIIVSNGANKTVKSSTVTILSSATTWANDDNKVPTAKSVSGYVASKTTNMVTGSSLTANQIVLGNNNSAVKVNGTTITSGDITTASDSTLPTTLAVSAFVTGYVSTANEEVVKSTSGWTADGKLVVTDGSSGRNIKQSSYTVTTAKVAASGNTTIPTNTAVYAAISELAIGAASSTADHIVTFNGTDGKTIKDSGKAFTNDAISAADAAKVPTNTAVYASISGLVSPSGDGFASGEVAVFADTTGRKIKTANVTISTTAPASGETAKIPTSDAVYSAISTAVTNVVKTAANDTVLTADKIVLGAGTKTVMTSSKGIVTSMSDTSDTANVPTASAVTAYVTDGLAALQTQIDALNTAVAALN